MEPERAAFEVSPQECADLVVRSRSGAQKRFHWVVVVGLGVLFFYWARAGTDGSPGEYVLAMAIGLVGATMAHLGIGYLDRWQVRAAVRPLYRRHGRLFVEVELRDDGVLFQQAGSDILIRWSEVKEARLGKDGIEIWNPERLIGLVRERGFDSKAEMMAFLEEVGRRAEAG